FPFSGMTRGNMSSECGGPALVMDSMNTESCNGSSFLPPFLSHPRLLSLAWDRRYWLSGCGGVD
ncbi:MAG TPA: hypothetical protein PLC86_16060, partial [Candidatus Accumulibacter phosphatis]|nr:hypothetical protein [Candidatus Accumulibacter phosphatis]